MTIYIYIPVEQSYYQSLQVVASECLFLVRLSFILICYIEVFVLQELRNLVAVDKVLFFIKFMLMYIQSSHR